MIYWRNWIFIYQGCVVRKPAQLTWRRIITQAGIALAVGIGISAPAAASLIYGPGESFAADFDVSGQSPSPPFNTIVFTLSFSSTADGLDPTESVRLDLFDSSSILSNSIVQTGGGGGFSVLLPLTPNFLDDSGSAVITALGNTSFQLRDAASGPPTFQLGFSANGGAPFASTGDLKDVITRVPAPPGMALFGIALVSLLFTRQRRLRHKCDDSPQRGSGLQPQS